MFSYMTFYQKCLAKFFMGLVFSILLLGAGPCPWLENPPPYIGSLACVVFSLGVLIFAKAKVMASILQISLSPLLTIACVRIEDQAFVRPILILLSLFLYATVVLIFFSFYRLVPQGPQPMTKKQR